MSEGEVAPPVRTRRPGGPAVQLRLPGRQPPRQQPPRSGWPVQPHAKARRWCSRFLIAFLW